MTKSAWAEKAKKAWEEEMGDKPRLTDKRFTYVPSMHTDIRRRFNREQDLPMLLRKQAG